MSTISTDRPAAPSPDASQAPSPKEPPQNDMTMRELAHKVYAFFYSKKVGLVLILVMAFLAFLGAVISQAPEAVRTAEPGVFDEWVESVRPRYGGWTDILAALGLFNVFTSVWFQGTSALLCLSIVACTTHRIPQLWQRATDPHLHVGDRFFEHASIRQDATYSSDRDTTREAFGAHLRKSGYRVIVDPKDPDGSFYADKNRWMPFGTSLAHAAFVVIIGGMVVTSALGFRDASFAVPVGDTREVGRNTGLSVHVNSFQDSYYSDGRPSDYVADLTVLKDGAEVARQEVRVNEPLRYDGVAFYQSYFGAAAAMTITGPGGEQIFSGSVPLQYSTENEANVFGRLELPEQQLTLFVIAPASGRTDTPIAPGQVQVDAYRGDGEQVIDNVILDQGVTGQVAGTNITFERERQFTGLQVSRDPGAPVIWVGSALLIIGTTLTMGFKHRRLWVRVTDVTGADGAPRTRLRVASADRKDAIYARQLERLVIEHGVATASTDPGGDVSSTDSPNDHPTAQAGIAGHPTK